MYKKTIFLIFLFCFALQSLAQDLFTLTTIQKIEIHFSQSDWDDQLDALKVGSDKYLMATWVKINGVVFDSVGVKYKGNSSYDSTHKKNAIHIELNSFKSQSYQGYTDIKLGNSYSDPSMIREVLGYTILEKYTECPKANFAELTINGIYKGLYSNTENINKKFCSDRFFSSSNTFIKCNPSLTPGPTVKSNLKFMSGDSSDYFDYYEKKSKDGWKELVKLCDTLTNHTYAIGSIMDMDRAIWMLAFNNVLMNLDSYSGAFAQNYYLYKDQTQHFNPILWDLNMAFGGFPFAGSPNNGMGSLTLSNMQQFSLYYHENHTDWPLINAVLANPSYRKMYTAHAKTIVNDFFTKGEYVSLATNLQNLIDKSVQSDSSKFYSYSQFKSGLTSNVNIGTYSVPGIKNLMDTRATYLSSTTEFNWPSPSITAIKANPITPAYNASITISAKVKNALPSNVYLGHRNDIAKKFQKIKMFDDGLHGDGLANDSVYGASLTMSKAYLHYFIYAENTNASIFSPERAEHNYYQISLPTDTIKKGDLVINEFLAINDHSDKNEYGIYSDWIELFNNTTKELNLTGYFLSDNLNSFQKYSFDVNTILAPKAFLGVWADDLMSTKTYMHTGFNLSGSSGHVVLSNSKGAIIDSISYSHQTADISIGRCPNGTGKFSTIEIPTFLGDNSKFCFIGISKPLIKDNAFLVFPNPTTQNVNLVLRDFEHKTLDVFDSYGHLIKTITLVQKNTVISLADFNSGVYIYKVRGSHGQLLNQGRIIRIK